MAEKKGEAKELAVRREKLSASLHSKERTTLLLQANIELHEARERTSGKQELLLAAQHELQQLEGADRVDDEVRASRRARLLACFDTAPPLLTVLLLVLAPHNASDGLPPPCFGTA